ncbi:MAG: 3-oxoacyl-[acyl-carrier-protein] synthase 3 [Pseudomonadota bacterium]
MSMGRFARIAGTGSYLPELRLSNQDLVDRLAKEGVESSDDWIKTRSGISARHFAAADQLTSDLAVKAAQLAIMEAQWNAADIELIILATSTPDHLGGFPSTACVIQDKRAGFSYALSTADAFIRAGMYQKILVIGAEVFSRILDFKDRGTCVLFGDGAGAVALEASDQAGILASALHADGSQRDILCIPGRASCGGIEGIPFLHMDGQAVFKLAVKVLEQVAHEVLQKANMQPEQIDWLVPHQANIRIMEGTARKMGMSMDRVIVTVNEHGNTSAASIPLALDHGIRSGQIKRGQHILLEGVGGGFAWGAVVLRY